MSIKLKEQQLTDIVGMIPPTSPLVGKGVITRLQFEGTTYVIPVPSQDRVTSQGNKVEFVLNGRFAVPPSELASVQFGTTGGGRDPHDTDTAATAARETQEETLELTGDQVSVKLFQTLSMGPAIPLPLKVMQWVETVLESGKPGIAIPRGVFDLVAHNIELTPDQFEFLKAAGAMPIGAVKTQALRSYLQLLQTDWTQHAA
jgi:hypothetical protein